VFAVVVGSGFAGAGIWINANIPDFNEAVRPCMEREASTLPALRAATCLCYAEAVRTFSATTYALITAASSCETSMQAALNTCRAKSFGMNSTPKR